MQSVAMTRCKFLAVEAEQGGKRRAHRSLAISPAQMRTAGMRRSQERLGV